MEGNNRKNSTIREGSLLDIPLNMLHPYGCKSYGKADITQLVESIEEFGVLQPIAVIGPYYSGTDPITGEGYGAYYKVLDGWERICAVNQINGKSRNDKFSEVPCFVLALESSDNFVQMQLWLALHSKVHDRTKVEILRFEQLEMLDSLRGKGKIKRPDVTKIFQKSQGVSERFADMYYKIFRRGCPELKKAVIYGSEITGKVHISVENAAKIAQYDEDIQKQVLARANAGEDIKEILKEL